MENLSLNDPGPGLGLQGQQGPLPSGPGGPMMPPPPQQLPPQMFTTAAQLLDLTDKKLMVVLRDGRKLIGVLRSWDQFANLVLQSTTERIFISPRPSEAPSRTNPNGALAQPGLYADIPRGVFLVRGENVLLLGEIDLDKDDIIPEGYEQASVEKVHALAKAEQKERSKREKRKVDRLRGEGFEGENAGEVLLI